MLFIICIMIILMSLSSIIMSIASILSLKSIYDQEKNSPFECGFDPFSSSRLPFSLHFFLIAIIFLIFDIEIALLLPLVILYSSSMQINFMITGIIFLMILLIGLYYEWNQKMLDWA
uniref:NADH dehydrogenase subunit 3 n=1 Tax=Neopsylla specialis TaxID=129382 RepID=UPI002411265A|nr:NADH dehydrogenase subunit 3 [Neopsylla specialis]WEQ92383.1 NADH dehydrogenase subunit 3 [Neopsylla specialis]